MSKVAAGKTVREFYELFPEGFFQSYLDQGIDKHQLWAEICEMHRWSLERGIERTAKGWGQFARNWLKKKGEAASKAVAKADAVATADNSLQAILMRISKDYPHLNVTQVQLIADYLRPLTPAERDQVRLKVADSCGSFPKPSDFKGYVQDLRNSRAMVNNTLKIANEPMGPRNDTWIAEQCRQNGLTGIWDLIKQFKKKPQ